MNINPSTNNVENVFFLNSSIFILLNMHNIDNA
jgi:hypothetical protein